MKNILFLLSAVALPFIFTGCGEDEKEEVSAIPGNAVELKVDETSLQIAQNDSRTVNITDGNGDYTVASSNEEVATATVSDNVITISALPTDNNAETVIVVTDKYFKRAYIEVETAAVFGLWISKTDVTLYSQVKGEDTHHFKIITGNGGYKVEYLENPNNCTELIGAEEIETTDAFSVKGLDNGTAKLQVSDREGKTQTITVKVVAPEPLLTDVPGEILQLNAVQGQRNVNITSGNGKYKVEIADPTIVKAVVVDDKKITVTGKKNGSTSITITDSKNQVNTFTVSINGTNHSMQLGGNYWFFANFGKITDVKLVKVQQTTWEMVCRLDEFNWLQTFMGLEGRCLLRKNGERNADATHYMELSALGDGLKVECSTPLKLHEWMHIALVLDCSKTATREHCRIFINGVEDHYKIQNESNKFTEVDLTSSGDDNKFTFGKAFDYGRMMKGAIGEARIWTVARTAEQIKANAWKLTEQNPVGLLGHWEFNAGISTNYIQDLSNGKFESNLTICSTGSFNPVNNLPTGVWIPKEYLTNKAK